MHLSNTKDFDSLVTTFPRPFHKRLSPLFHHKKPSRKRIIESTPLFPQRPLSARLCFCSLQRAVHVLSTCTVIISWKKQLNHDMRFCYYRSPVSSKGSLFSVAACPLIVRETKSHSMTPHHDLWTTGQKAAPGPINYCVTSGIKKPNFFHFLVLVEVQAKFKSESFSISYTCILLSQKKHLLKVCETSLDI